VNPGKAAVTFRSSLRKSRGSAADDTGATGETRNAIDVHDVVMRYPARDGSEVLALDRLNMHVGPGEFVGIVGPSGCGKSTLLKLVAGIGTATEGTLSRAGEIISGPQPDVGFVFQSATLLPWLTVLQNTTLPARVLGLPKKASLDRARDLLASVGLAGFDNQYPGELSGGMQQRVAICRALLHEPKLLLMDEPFASIDALTRDRLATELQTILLTHRVPALFVTHSIPEALFLSDRVLVMSARPGRLLAEFALTTAKPRVLEEAYADPEAIGAEIRELLSGEHQV
jgi:NitT/TauT family transport system ATP-binding protein